MLLYIERWLKADVISVEGKWEARSEGTPQGGVISPLLANLLGAALLRRRLVVT